MQARSGIYSDWGGSLRLRFESLLQKLPKSHLFGSLSINTAAESLLSLCMQHRTLVSLPCSLSCFSLPFVSLPPRIALSHAHGIYRWHLMLFTPFTIFPAYISLPQEAMKLSASRIFESRTTLAMRGHASLRHLLLLTWRTDS